MCLHLDIKYMSNHEQPRPLEDHKNIQKSILAPKNTIYTKYADLELGFHEKLYLQDELFWSNSNQASSLEWLEIQKCA